MRELWLVAAVGGLAAGVVRSSLTVRRVDGMGAGAVLALWLGLTAADIARLPPALVYGPLTDRDTLGLVLVIVLGEAGVTIRSSLRLVDGESRAQWWRRMFAATPTFTQFLAVRLIAAEAFQFVPSSLGFEQFGWALAATTGIGLATASLLMRVVLPRIDWRVELHLTMRLVMIVGAAYAFAASSAGPLAAPDASFSARRVLVVAVGCLAVAMTGALLGPAVARLRARVINPHLL